MVYVAIIPEKGKKPSFEVDYAIIRQPLGDKDHLKSIKAAVPAKSKDCIDPSVTYSSDFDDLILRIEGSKLKIMLKDKTLDELVLDKTILLKIEGQKYEILSN